MVGMAEKDNIDASSPTPIAIVGVACRFPGDASSPENLWNVLSNGKSAWREFPADRLNINGFYHPSVRSDSVSWCLYLSEKWVLTWASSSTSRGLTL
jgi:hypothetical protein